MIVRDFLICLLQMYLLEDLEKNMLPYRRENFLGKFLVYFVIALVMLGINHLESSIFNMVMIPVTYMIVSMVVFRGNIWKKLVIVCCYYVLAIIPEFLFATLTNAYGVTGASEGFGTEIEKTLALLLMSTMTWKSFAWTVDGSCRRGIENLSGICFGANCHRRIFFGRRLFRRYNINKRKICLCGRRKEQDLSHWR